ncbi:unnamed protein product [Mytilus edulis]|uniref:Uncharacterized protein n=1 Tax=Mytilus edulis TaxID=6550 RepID=A0A8S3PS84_MYTED|nr:unnamed protein product [Mytilus edulis]
MKAEMVMETELNLYTFKGFAGGGYYGESGSAAEYVCLPPDPNYVKTSGGADNGHITNQATSVIMIPGKNTCYSGWKLEYHGYLASGYYGHTVASAYVCVDIKPEYIMGGVDFHYVKRISTENQQQTLIIQQQEKTIQQHQTSTFQQQAWFTQQNTSIQQQQATLQQQQALIQQQQKTIQQQQTINQQQQTINQQLEQTIKQLQSSINSIPTLGTTYVRWGRKQCPNKNTELVYSGFAGGSHYTDKGAAAEYVCLPPDPNYVKTSGGDNGRMFGAEFDNNFFASNADNEDVPCALCRTKLATSVIMIPGKNTCYKGWKVEYHGYLASGYHAHVAASAYACVELNPEYIIGGVDEHVGKLFYEVLSKCGSLKCPPYINNYPLTCVVCSK